MDTAIDTVRQKKLTDKFDIIRALMERAEQLSTDGDVKKQMVIEAFVKLHESDPTSQRTFQAIPLNSISLIIDAIVYATKTAIAINKRTGCFDKFKQMFTKK